MVSGFTGLKVSSVWIDFGQFMDTNKDIVAGRDCASASFVRSKK